MNCGINKDGFYPFSFRSNIGQGFLKIQIYPWDENLFCLAFFRSRIAQCPLTIQMCPCDEIDFVLFPSDLE